MQLLEKLNDAQKKAVITTEGPVMVMAGAGSGKTRVLTHRMAFLIKECGIPKKNILAVTFTNKAAREMKERVYALIDEKVDDLWVSTFHSCCARILRKEIIVLEGYRRNFNIIDEDDSIKIIKDIMKILEIDPKDYPAKQFKNMISNVKNDDYIPSDDFELNDYFDHIYEQYQHHLHEENLLDFDDLISITIKVFETNDSVLNRYQESFQYIMIDEFQDTNKIQYKLIKLLANKYRNIFIVGDQDQSIYSFRGARVENIDLFQRDFTDTQIILLEQNYRSIGNILSLANAIIDKNPNRIKKNLFTENKDNFKPVYYRAETGYEEAVYVKDKIIKLLEQGFHYKDFAVLYRANALSRSYEDIFLKYQIPYKIYGGVPFFGRKEVKDILSYLRLAVDTSDDFSFKRIVNEPKRKIGDSVIEKLLDIKLEKKCSLFEAIDDVNVSKMQTESLLNFKFLMMDIQDNIDKLKLPDLIELVLEKSTYKTMLENMKEEGIDRLENVYELKSILQESDEFYEGTTKEKLMAFLNDVSLKTDSDNVSETDNSVKMMTYHQAKGLEYNIVFMVAMETGIFPSHLVYRATDLEEERRICYVGITRARKQLYLTNAQTRRLYGNILNNAPSIFINELNKEFLECYGKIDKGFTNTIKIHIDNTEKTNTNSQFNAGDKINHISFGDGVVVSAEKEYITVAFKVPFGIKKLLAAHPSIRRI